jgi:predicted O-methyltransferase YrrM
MKINNFLDTDYWFNYSGFYDFVSDQNFEKIVEVGVWKGHSISYLADKNRNSKIWAVDLFEETDDVYYQKPHLKDQLPHIYEIYNANLVNKNVRDIVQDIKGDSFESAKHFEDNSIDFVFIDASHEYDKVKKDISAWYDKVKEGGMISGHDYGSFPGVKQAVDELVKDKNLELNTARGSVWFCYKK